MKLILRVPDYYDEFTCIAGDCKDSCCIGWEIDIDEDTYQYYGQIKGELGERFQKYMYETKDREHSFRLVEHGRCPFLNSSNLCDICIHLGEEALSEVCTEYPRFTLEYDSLQYGIVVQKCMSLSCEEVGRLLFTRETPVQFVSHVLEAKEEVLLEEDVDYSWIAEMEALMMEMIAGLQDRSLPMDTRIQKVLSLAWKHRIGQAQTTNAPVYQAVDSFDDYQKRFALFCRMETLDSEWTNQKRHLQNTYTADTYEQIISEYRLSTDYNPNDYEQLMVYFIFRYFMNAAYDYEPYTYVKLAVVFTKMIMDMDALRFRENENHYSREDRIDVVRIFSKEVEHSQENVELARDWCGR